VKGCIQPCSGVPVLRTKPGAVRVAADHLAEWVQCSGCGYAPLPEEQPVLVHAFKLRMWVWDNIAQIVAMFVRHEQIVEDARKVLGTLAGSAVDQEKVAQLEEMLQEGRSLEDEYADLLNRCHALLREASERLGVPTKESDKVFRVRNNNEQ